MCTLAKRLQRTSQILEVAERNVQPRAQTQSSPLLEATVSTLFPPRPLTQMLLLAARQKGLNLRRSMIEQKLIMSYPLIRRNGMTRYGLDSTISMWKGSTFGRMAPRLSIPIGSLTSPPPTQVQAVWPLGGVTRERTSLLINRLAPQAHGTT